MKLLTDLYFTHSPTRGGEEKMSAFVQNKLKERGILDYKTLNNQIYRIIPDTPMVCAHLDQMSFIPLTKLLMYNDIISGDSNLGADDKNGIWIILRLLEKYKDISFIFSSGEESGGDIDLVLELTKDELESIKYCLIFDRRNGKDIVGTNNFYCENDLEDAIVDIAKPLGYRSTTGLWSDCDIISQYVPCVNLSCGYYMSHTKSEYTKINELKRSLELGGLILSQLDSKYKRCEFCYNDNMYPVHYKKHTYNYNYNYIDEYKCPSCGEYFLERELVIGDICPICYTTVEKEDDVIDTCYCGYCAEYFKRSEMIFDDRCPNCGRAVEEDFYDYDTEKYAYCSVCDEHFGIVEVVDNHCIFCDSALIVVDGYEDIAEG